MLRNIFLILKRIIIPIFLWLICCTCWLIIQVQGYYWLLVNKMWKIKRKLIFIIHWKICKNWWNLMKKKLRSFGIVLGYWLKDRLIRQFVKNSWRVFWDKFKVKIVIQLKLYSCLRKLFKKNVFLWRNRINYKKSSWIT